MATKKKPTDPVNDETAFMLAAIEQYQLGKEIKEKEERRATLTAQLKDDIDKYGTPDASGNIVYEGQHGSAKITVTNGLRVSTSLVTEAVELLTKKGLAKEYTETQVVVKTIDLKSDIEAGIFPDKKLAARLYETKEGRTLTVKVKDKASKF